MAAGGDHLSPTEAAKLRAQLEGLRDIRAKGVLEVAHEGETVRFRTDAELVAAINDIEARLEGPRRHTIRRIVVGTRKGF